MMVPRVVKVFNGSTWVPAVPKFLGKLFTTSGSWLCPAGVTQIMVECWGGGGGGGGLNTDGSSGGGGGGAYARRIVTVVPGITYNFTVGLGGSGGAATNGNGGDGGDTLWGDGTLVKAVGGKGGLGGPSTTGGGLGGSALNCIGTVSFSGGKGGNGGVLNQAGGGGGGAGSLEDGGAGVDSFDGTSANTGGSGGFRDGGDGGHGLTVSGSNPGARAGGGASCTRRGSGSRAGSEGGPGQIKIAYGSTPFKVSDYILEEIFATSGSWLCPAGVTHVQIECWGAGGGGGGNGSSPGSAAGGGGGAYARKTVAVIPGNIYNYTVGLGGTGGAASGDQNGTDGGDTFWDAGTDVKAAGGKGGRGYVLGNPAAGAGGSVANSIGTTRYAGGNGGAGQSGSSGTYPGGGGSGAGSTKAGNAGGASSTTTPPAGVGGAAVPEYGGAGGSKTVLGNGSAPGSVAGGGGTGAKRESGAGSAGGNGARGQVRIRFGREFLAEYQAVLDRADALLLGKPTNIHRIYQNQFIYDLIVAGIWNLIDVLYILASNGSSGFTTINIKDVFNFKSTIVGSPIFTPNAGFKSNAGGYLNTNFPVNRRAGIETDFSVLYYLDTASISVGFQVPFGAQTNSGGQFLVQRPQYSGVGTTEIFLYGGMVPSGNANHQGFYNLTHRAGNDASWYKDAAEAVLSVASGAPNLSNSIYLLGWNSGGTLTEPYTTGNMSFFAFTKALTDAQHAAFYAAWNKYRRAIGLNSHI